MQWIRTVAVALALPALAIAQTRPADVTQRNARSVRTEQLAMLEFPWGMAYLPDGRLLITEKPGRLRIFEKGKPSAPIAGLPSILAITDEKSGALLRITPAGGEEHR